MKTEKLSLDAFKAMADNVQTEEAMSKIEGGLENSWSDCHGFWGQLHKFVIEVLPILLPGGIK